jgi:EAL domain-containing protein (putative c-di-GMP-specific phosphodiesterase class I)
VPVCAEGVETAGQLAQLRDEGCQEVQGYLFARPVPSESVAALMAGWSGETVRRPVRLLAPGASSPAA